MGQRYAINIFYMEGIILLEIIAILFIVISSPKVKGIIGERFIAYRLSRLDPDKYLVINDLFVEIGGKTSQIDHLVISIHGIFVIETKNYKGWIFGSDSSKYWKQIIHKRKESFYNPVWQNNGHIKILQEILSESNSSLFVSIVVFPLKATFKKLNTRYNVIHSYKLKRLILKYQEVVLDQERVNSIYNNLMSANIIEKTRKRVLMKEHIRNIRSYKK